MSRAEVFVRDQASHGNVTVRDKVNIARPDCVTNCMTRNKSTNSFKIKDREKKKKKKTSLPSGSHDLAEVWLQIHENFF